MINACWCRWVIFFSARQHRRVGTSALLVLVVGISCQTFKKRSKLTSSEERAVAISYFTEGKFSEAIQRFEALHQKFPADLPIADFLAQSYLSRHQLKLTELSKYFYTLLHTLHQNDGQGAVVPLEAFFALWPEGTAEANHDFERVDALYTQLTQQLQNSDSSLYNSKEYYKLLYIFFNIRQLYGSLRQMEAQTNTAERFRLAFTIMQSGELLLFERLIYEFMQLVPLLPSRSQTWIQTILSKVSTNFTYRGHDFSVPLNKLQPDFLRQLIRQALAFELSNSSRSIQLTLAALHLDPLEFEERMLQVLEGAAKPDILFEHADQGIFGGLTDLSAAEGDFVAQFFNVESKLLDMSKKIIPESLPQELPSSLPIPIQ